MLYRLVAGTIVYMIGVSLLIPLQALELEDYRIVDLSHAYGEETLYWPTSPSAFEKQTLANGFTADTEDAYFYSAYTVCTPEHGGTHLDAPVHFAEDGVSIPP
jgi:kynurenine formamidase